LRQIRRAEREEALDAATRAAWARLGDRVFPVTMRLERLLLAAGLTVWATGADAWIIETVGPNGQFPTISAAVNAQTAGHLYEIDVAAGTYQNDFSVITNPTDIEAKGGPVTLLATVPPPNLKADPDCQRADLSGSRNPECRWRQWRGHPRSKQYRNLADRREQQVHRQPGGHFDQFGQWPHLCRDGQDPQFAIH
jgi:hypothetical protein